MKLTFFNDDWYVLLQRPGLESHAGPDVLLAPHNGNLVALLVAIVKVLVAVFGLHSQLPFRIVSAACVVAVGVLVYFLVSARVGRVLGLVAAAIMLFLGPASEALLFLTGTLDLVGALAFGLAALYVIERDTPRRNVLACVLLTCSVLMSNGGLPFVVGAAIAIVLRRRPAQLWVALIPAVVFGLWWIFDGSTAPSTITSSNLAHLPRYVFDAVSVGIAAATGTNHQGSFRYSTVRPARRRNDRSRGLDAER